MRRQRYALTCTILRGGGGRAVFHLVFDLHLVQDCSPVVGDRHVSVGADKHLVHALGAQRRSKDVAYAPSREDVRLGL